MLSTPVNNRGDIPTCHPRRNNRSTAVYAYHRAHFGANSNPKTHGGALPSPTTAVPSATLPTATSIPEPTETLEPTATPVPTGTSVPTATPVPTATSVPTATPVPEGTPVPKELSLTIELAEPYSGRDALFTLQGLDPWEKVAVQLFDPNGQPAEWVTEYESYLTDVNENPVTKRSL